MKNIACWLLLVLSPTLVHGQPKRSTHSFHLSGTIKADTGTVLLLPVGGSDFDPNKTNNYKAKIQQGRFRFEGTMTHPTAYQIAFFPTYVSSPFILEAGSQTIRCNVDSLREIPRIINQSMRELAAAPVNFFSSLTVSPHRQAALLTYTRQHPNSYVALWETIRQLASGYTPILDSISRTFSTTLQTTYIGKRVVERLASNKVIAPGQVFPTLSLLDMDKKTTAIPSLKKPKYTLIDFWYVRCSACISQFPELRKVLETYKDKGFVITGISIDKPEDVELWKNTITKRELVWDHYLDAAGKLTYNQLHLNYFPSNFLLDEQGIIIKRDIRPFELNKFLSERL